MERKYELVDKLMAQFRQQLLLVESILFLCSSIQVFLLADLERVELAVVFSSDEEHL